MSRFLPVAVRYRFAAGLALLAASSAGFADALDPASVADAASVEQIVVIAQRLNEGRANIQTQTGASTYVIDQAAINAAPGGDNQLLNQVIMQAPDVAQDSFGQFHVRGEINLYGFNLYC